MLQRLQSIWLLLAAVLAIATLKLSFFSGNILVNNAKEFQRFTAMSNIPLMILTVGVGFASLITIFIFKDRKLQMKINAAILAISLINIVLAYLQTGNFIANEWTYDLTSLVYMAIPILLILSLRGIYKDEQLVKSADRLR